jgi:hypothetical protein
VPGGDLLRQPETPEDTRLDPGGIAAKDEDSGPTAGPGRTPGGTMDNIERDRIDR